MRRVNERVLSPRATLRRAMARPGRAHAVRPRPGRWALLALLLLVPGLLWPLVALAWEALTPAGELSAGALGDALTGEAYRDRLVFSGAQAFVSTALAAGLGLPVAWALAQAPFPGHRAVRALALLPFLLPSVAVGLAFRELLGADAAATGWGLVLAHGWMGMGAFAALTSVAWARLDPRVSDTARVLGAPRWRAFIEVTLPALAPSLAAAAALAFTLAATSFGVVLLLGGGVARLDTVELAAWRVAEGAPAGVPAEVAAIALLQLVLTLAALAVYVAFRWQQPGGTAPRARLDAPAARRPVLVGVLVGALVVVLVPLAALQLGALSEGADGLTASHFTALFEEGRLRVDVGPALLRSLAYAAGATLITVLAAVAAASAVARWQGGARRWAAGVLLLPAAVPGVLLALALTAGFDADAPWLVLLAHAVLAYPFVARPLLAARLEASRGAIEAPPTLGASPARAWWHAELRGARRAMMVGAVFASVVSLGESGASALLTGGTDEPTAAAAILGLLGGEAGGGPAMALASVLVLIVAAAVLAVEWVAGRDAGRQSGEF